MTAGWGCWVGKPTPAVVWLNSSHRTVPRFLPLPPPASPPPRHHAARGKGRTARHRAAGRATARRGARMRRGGVEAAPCRGSSSLGTSLRRFVSHDDRNDSLVRPAHLDKLVPRVLALVVVLR